MGEAKKNMLPRKVGEGSFGRKERNPLFVRGKKSHSRGKMKGFT